MIVFLIRNSAKTFLIVSGASKSCLGAELYLYCFFMKL
jgi:hypothetical protein